MTQSDFLKSIANIYGITFVPDNVNKIIYLKQFKELYAAKAYAKNMTAKRDQKKKATVETRLGTYAQTNWMKWREDKTNKTIGLGNGSFTVDDENLPKEKDLFVLPYAASEDVTRLIGLKVVRCQKLHNGIFTGNTEPRLFMLNMVDITDGNGDIVYKRPDGTTEASVNTDIPLTYFIRNDKLDSLGFDQNLMNEEYRHLIEFMLDNPKVVKDNYNLTVNDVVDFDHFIPWYDDEYGNYFYVNIIRNFVKGKITSVELIRM